MSLKDTKDMKKDVIKVKGLKTIKTRAFVI